MSINSARRRSVSSLTPVGAGAPSARKVAALPRWRSATNSVFAAGAKAARSGKSFRTPERNSLERVQESAAFSSCATIRSMRADKVSFDSRSRRRCDH